MKVKLLKKLRRRGRNQIKIYSVTREEEDIVVGMKIGYNDDAYSDVFDFGLTKEDVLKRAENIYIEKYISKKRKKRLTKQ